MKHLKQEFDKLTFKEALMYSLAIFSVMAGIALIFIGLYLPPKGEIHNSVLTAFGLVLAFAGSILGISQHYSAEFDKFKFSVMQQIKDLSGNKPESADVNINTNDL